VALQYATFRYNPNVVKYLINKGANVTEISVGAIKNFSDVSWLKNMIFLIEIGFSHETIYEAFNTHSTFHLKERTKELGATMWGDPSALLKIPQGRDEMLCYLKSMLIEAI
jgi:hypothetical protein